MNKATLSDLRAFMAVAQHHSFSRAADNLGVARPSLSNAIRNLEETLGARLLHRTTRSVSLTDAGKRLLARLNPLVVDLDAALREVSGDQSQVQGPLRINGNAAAIGWLLKAVVPVFMARHPRVELDLVSEGRLVDIVAQGFDAGIRLAEAVPKDMVGVAFGGGMRFLAVASPKYLAMHSAPETPDALNHHKCIRQRLPSGKRYRWEFARHGQEIAIDVPGALTLDNSPLMVEAAINGLGIAYVPETYALIGLEAGTLVTVLEDWCPPIAGHTLYFSSSRQVPPPLRALINTIRELDLVRSHAIF